jgi:hypothetical protein
VGGVSERRGGGGGGGGIRGVSERQQGRGRGRGRRARCDACSYGGSARWSRTRAPSPRCRPPLPVSFAARTSAHRYITSTQRTHARTQAHGISAGSCIHVHREAFTCPDCCARSSRPFPASPARSPEKIRSGLLLIRVTCQSCVIFVKALAAGTGENSLIRMARLLSGVCSIVWRSGPCRTRIRRRSSGEYCSLAASPWSPVDFPYPLSLIIMYK